MKRLLGVTITLSVLLAYTGCATTEEADRLQGQPKGVQLHPEPLRSVQLRPEPFRLEPLLNYCPNPHPYVTIVLPNHCIPSPLYRPPTESLYPIPVVAIPTT